MSAKICFSLESIFDIPFCFDCKQKHIVFAHWTALTKMLLFIVSMTKWRWLSFFFFFFFFLTSSGPFLLPYCCPTLLPDPHRFIILSSSYLTVVSVSVWVKLQVEVTALWKLISVWFCPFHFPCFAWWALVSFPDLPLLHVFLASDDSCSSLLFAICTSASQFPWHLFLPIGWYI